MIDISSYLLAGFSVLPTIKITIDEVDIDCLFNQSDHNDSKTYGGFEPDNSAVVSIKTSLLTNPKEMKGKVVTIDEEEWRVIKVRYGASVTHLTIMSKHKA